MSSTREYWTASNSWTDELNEYIMTDSDGDLNGMAVGAIRQVDGKYVVDIYPHGEYGGIEIYEIDSHESYDDAFASAIAILDDFYAGE